MANSDQPGRSNPLAVYLLLFFGVFFAVLGVLAFWGIGERSPMFYSLPVVINFLAAWYLWRSGRKTPPAPE